MDKAGGRVERVLESAFASTRDRNGPERLATALRYAVFPGGARLRPRLVLATAEALGGFDPETADAAAAAIELVHCASLVHDDLPCFDDASTRRGKASVHVEFGQPTAVLVGDALIVMAFQALARAKQDRLAELMLALTRGVGHPTGIIAGQAWESEPEIRLFAYHRAKTASLFEAACAMGAIAAGHDPHPWRVVGELLGRAYQVADDVADVHLSVEESGKTGDRDRVAGRPSAYERLGAAECRSLVERLLGDAAAAVPECSGREAMQAWLSQVSLGVLAIRTPKVANGRPSTLSRLAAK